MIAHIPTTEIFLNRTHARTHAHTHTHSWLRTGKYSAHVIMNLVHNQQAHQYQVINFNGLMVNTYFQINHLPTTSIVTVFETEI